MELKRIVTNSLKYPLRNIAKLPMIFVLFILIAIIPIGVIYDNNYVVMLGIFSLSLFILIVPGYLLSIVLKGSSGSTMLPSLSLGQNIYDSIRVLILRIAYMLIPLAMLITVLYTLGLTSIDLLFNLKVDSFLVTFLLMLLLIVLTYIVFEFLFFFAKARLAYLNNLTEALKIHKVIIDIKTIGLRNIIKWLILMAVSMIVISVVSSVVLVIPYVGFLIYIAVVIPVMESISNYSLGALYANIAENSLEDMEFDKLENDIERLKYFNFR